MSFIDTYNQQKRTLAIMRDYAQYLSSETRGIGHALDKGFRSGAKHEPGIVDRVTFELSVPPGKADVDWNGIARELSKYLPQAAKDAAKAQEERVEQYRKAAEAEALEVLRVTTGERL